MFKIALSVLFASIAVAAISTPAQAHVCVDPHNQAEAEQCFKDCDESEIHYHGSTSDSFPFYCMSIPVGASASGPVSWTAPQAIAFVGTLVRVVVLTPWAGIA
jgi:hypothetical protein